MSRNLSVTQSSVGVGDIADLVADGSNFRTTGGRTFVNISTANIKFSEAQIGTSGFNYLNQAVQNPSQKSISTPEFAADISANHGATDANFDIYSEFPVVGGVTVLATNNNAVGPARVIRVGPTGVSYGAYSTVAGLSGTYAFNQPNTPANIVVTNGVGGALYYNVSTDGGITFGPQVIINQSLFANNTAFRLGNSTANTSFGCGYRYQAINGQTNNIWSFNAGQRVIYIGNNAGNTATVASSTVDGFTGYNTDASTAVLGAASLASTNNQFFYFKRSGNNSFFITGSGTLNGTASTARFSTDGGVTFTTVTGIANLNNVGQLTSTTQIQDNGSTRFLYNVSGLSTAAFSSNFGASWVARTLPFSVDATNSNSTDTIAMMGTLAILVDYSAGIVYRTADDFATFTTIARPAGVNGTALSCFTCGDRFYIAYSDGKIASTVDGLTFIVRTVQNQSSIPINTFPFSCAKVNGRIVTASASSSVNLVSPDDGVTWFFASLLGGNGGAVAAMTYTRGIPVSGGVGLLYAGNRSGSSLSQNNGSQLVLADFTTFKSIAPASTAVTSLRTGAQAHLRVA